MDRDFDAPPAAPAILDIVQPAAQSLPVVLASPHSGRDYPAEFLAAARLDGHALRRSEDCFVDEIFLPASQTGAPLLRALFPRAFLDPNREAYELDPAMFADRLPAYVNTRSARVAAGLGTIAKVVASGQEIYRSKLCFADAVERISRHYHPYHSALKGLVDGTVARFGTCLLVDCHSMPSTGGPNERDAGRPRQDIVLGDCHGNACAGLVSDAAEAVLKGMGYSVGRNSPYAGGFTTRHYGRPRHGVHALQIEINRGLYMDEARYSRKPYLPTLARHMATLVEALGALDLPR